VNVAAEIDETRTLIEGTAAKIVDKISRVATDFDMSTQVSQLKDIRSHLRTSADDEAGDDIFKIVVCGRFRNGKSTLLNALLTNASSNGVLPPGQKGPMPTADGIPTTAVATLVRYTEEPYVLAWHFDGSSEEWTFERYLKDARLWNRAEDNSKLFEHIKMFEVGYPAELLRSGVVLVDSPGTDEDPRRTDTTLGIIQDAAAAIIVYNSFSLAGDTEQSFAVLVKAHSGHSFEIINRMHGRELDAEYLAMAAQRLNYERTEFMKDSNAFDVYGIDVRSALDARVERNVQELERSGMAQFERRLSRFLLEERYPAYAEHVAKKIELIATQVEETVSRRTTVARGDVEKLDAVIHDCYGRLENISDVRNAIERIITRATRKVEREGLSSYRNLLSEMIDDVPREFEKTPIPSFKNLGDRFGALFNKKYVTDAVRVLNDIITRRTREWAESPDKGLSADIAPTLDGMRDEIVEKVKQIDSDVKAIRLSFSRLDPDVTPAELPQLTSTLERSLWVIAGGLMSDPAMMLTGGAAGWRGVAGGLAGAVVAGLAAGVISAVFGIVLAPAAVIAIIWAGMTTTSGFTALMNIEGRVRSAALKAVLPKLADLKTDGDVEATIVTNLNEALTKLKNDVLSVVDGVLSSERREIENAENSKKLDRADREAELLKLLDAAGVMRSAAGDVADLHARIRQTA